jgi:phosphoribosyl 1,2-cyclic phosphodiesterase
LDAGTGIRELGEDLLRRNKDLSGKGSRIQAHILISHLHWDHVQGFAFFAPAFLEGNEFDLYGVSGLECSLISTLRNQMSEPNFPITLDELGACFRFHDLEPGAEATIEEVSVRVEKLNHPGGSVGFRLEHEGKTLIYASDTEQVGEIDLALLEMTRGADLLIYDSMFAPEQYLGLWDNISRESWGHSTWEAAVELARAAGVKQLVLFHHGNDDTIVAEIEARARERFPRSTAAYEGLEIEL